ncbi:STAS domain-containing protein [Oceanobacillus senegalensis]|uniref:STAS domain-containing protein n=1 Tax=Oceanobacillus senegalensis TaxID=1936063 RepID=UPI000A313FA5|nr:STAS domain-containing protein [Oceanobacillus senegalensis]
MSSSKLVEKYFYQNAEPLAIEVVESVLQRMDLDIPNWEKEQAIHMYTELFQFLGEALIEIKLDKIPDVLMEWSYKNSEMQVSSGGDITDIILRYSPTRDVFNDIITRISIEHDLTVKENADILKRINHMLDISMNETMLSFKRMSDKCKTETEQQLLKLSAPIVPIKDEIVILPLIGSFEEKHFENIRENVVPKIVDMHVSYVILDLSGALMNSIQTTDFLCQLQHTFELMGIHLILTGMRPDMVQTIIRSGIDGSEISSFATVQQAVENIK